MRYISLLSLPRIKFAHSYEATDYDVCLRKVNQCIEITYLSAGSMTLSDGNEQHHADTGDVLCNLYGSDLRVISHGFHAHRTVCFSVDFCQSEGGTGEAALLPVVTPACERGQECFRLITEIIRIHTLYPEDSLRCSGLFLQLLGEMNIINRSADAPGKEYLYVKRAKKYIYDRLGLPIHQRDVAQHLGITPEYLCAVFKKSEGIPLMRFVNTAKLTSIRSLMEKERLSLAQASLLYGYTDPNYVSRLYKQYFHINITDAVQRYPYAHLDKYKIQLPTKNNKP